MEITNTSTQAVSSGANILFTETPIGGCKSILHREGSGIVKLKGLGSQCRARFRVWFNGQIAVPAGVTVQEISVAVALDGESIGASTMSVVPAAAADLWSVSTSILVDVPACCCSSLSVENTSIIGINVTNANLIVERVA